MSDLYNHRFLLICLVFKYPQMSLSNNVSLKILWEVFCIKWFQENFVTSTNTLSTVGKP